MTTQHYKMFKEMWSQDIKFPILRFKNKNYNLKAQYYENNNISLRQLVPIYI